MKTASILKEMLCNGKNSVNADAQRIRRKLVLTIGTDTGSEQIATNYAAGNLTAAQVCAAFGLTCN